ncbi:hypothetical protein FJ366_01245 [Candidatus Dependentiae bacterium]|nr:hypothetical protein [Candidatus Dependentiae bacterium]
MVKTHKIAYFLLVLQFLQLTGGLFCGGEVIVDAPEIMETDLPSANKFKQIQRQWIRVDVSSKKKVVSFDSAPTDIEKVISGGKSSLPKHRNNVLNFFIETSSKNKSLVHFSKERDWEDLQLFNAKTTLLDSCCRTATTSGEVLMAGLITHRPSIQTSLDRRDFISALSAKQDTRDILRKQVNRFSLVEETFFSLTMQPEDPVIRASIDDLKPKLEIPGLLKFLLFLGQPVAALELCGLEYLFKKTGSMDKIINNPEFIRWHAIITQKTAHYFWNPLINQLLVGCYFIINPLRMNNGIAFALLRNNFRNAIVSFDKDKDTQTLVSTMFKNIPLQLNSPENQIPPYTGPANDPVAQFIHSIPYRAKQGMIITKPIFTIAWYIAKKMWLGNFTNTNVFPLSPLKGFKSLLCLVNDLFFWNTNELRQAICDSKPTPPSTSASAAEKRSWENPGVFDGPYLSWSLNEHTHTSPFIYAAHSLLRLTHKSFFHEDPTSKADFVTDQSTKEKLKQIAINHIEKVKKENPGNTTAQNLLDRLSLITKPTDTYIDYLSWWKNVGTQTIKSLWNTFIAPNQLSTIDEYAQLIPRKDDLKEISSSLLGILSHYKNSPPERTSPSRGHAITQMTAWFVISILFGRWLDRHLNPKERVDAIDKIIFSATKPAMVLLSATSEIFDALTTNAHHFIFPPSLASKLALFKTTSSQHADLISYSKDKTFTQKTGHTIFDHIGKVRTAYDLIQTPDAKKLLALCIHIIAEVDCYLSVEKLSEEFSSTENKVSPVEFINAQSPFINIKNGWFPLFGTKSIGTDLLMGNGHSENILLTGLNGGGKSILLKNIVFNLMFAHAFGWAFATSCTITPFSQLILHLNSLDNAAEGKSRWVAEAEAIVDMIKAALTQRSAQYFIFASGDELGDGTAAQASINVMTKLLKAFSSQKHVLSIISSHLQPLTELEKTITRLKNCRINQQRKLEDGINKTNIALAIFEKFSNTRTDENGFAALLAKEIAAQEEQDQNSFSLIST